MTDKIFDDYMRDKLRNHASPVPDGLWEKIEKEKRRRPVGFFWGNPLMVIGLLFAVILGIGGLMWWKFDSNAQAIASKNETLNNKQQTANNNNTSTNSTIEIDTDHLPTSNNTKNITNGTSSIALNKKDGIVEDKALAIQENNNEKTVVAIKKTDAFKKSLATKNKVSNNELGQAEESNSLPITTNKKIGHKKNSYSAKQGVGVGTLLESSLTINSKGNQQISLKETIPPKNYGPGQLMFIGSKANLSTSNKLLPAFQLMKPSSVDCPNSIGKNDWYVELYGSPDYSIKSVKGDAASNAYLQKKDSTESMRIGYTVGARITKNIGEHLMLKAGLQLSQINERFTLRTENERVTTIVITSKTVTDAFGNTTIQNDTTSVTKIGYLVRTSNNHYRNVEVPVMLGYEFGNDNWKFSVNGGAIINVASWYKGRTLDTAYQTISLTSKSNGDIYKHNVGLSLYGSLSIIKPVAEKWDVFAEPYFRYSLYNLSSNTLGYNQRFNTFGLSFGIRYKLNVKRQR